MIYVHSTRRGAVKIVQMSRAVAKGSGTEKSTGKKFDRMNSSKNS
jgi:hypothetical protein